MSKSSKIPEVINHLTGMPMGKKATKVLLEAREARLGARRMARSGHPGRAAQGRKGVEDTTTFIRNVYVQDMVEQTS